MKYTKILLALSIMLLCLTVNLIAGNTGTGKLDMSLRSFDFGMVPRDAHVVHDFVLKNIGTDTIRITKIKPGCSCTNAPIDKKIIAVGEEATMSVTFKTGKRSGNSNKGVKITTDMKPRGLYPLEINAYIETPTMKPPKFYAEPRFIEFVPVPGDFTGSSKTKLINENDFKVLLKIIDYTDNLGAVKLSKDNLSSGKSCELEFEFNDKPSMLYLYGSITLEVSPDEGEAFRYTVPVIKKNPIPAEK